MEEALKKIAAITLDPRDWRWDETQKAIQDIHEIATEALAAEAIQPTLYARYSHSCSGFPEDTFVLDCAIYGEDGLFGMLKNLQRDIDTKHSTKIWENHIEWGRFSFFIRKEGVLGGEFVRSQKTQATPKPPYFGKVAARWDAFLGRAKRTLSAIEAIRENALMAESEQKELARLRAKYNT